MNIDETILQFLIIKKSLKLGWDFVYLPKLYDTEKVMKKVLFVLLISAGVLSCSTKENFDVEPGNPDLEITTGTQEGDPTKINAEVFNLINLDYPGLEQV